MKATVAMRLGELNALPDDDAVGAFLRCCGSTRWAHKMMAARPFASADAIAATSDVIWQSLEAADWLDAFAAHPRIGEGGVPAARGEGRAPQEGQERRAGAAGSDGWAAREQSGAASATGDVRGRLAAKNREYEARFGYIFIVCATGKSADEMLAILESRLSNDPGDELRVAADEQRKITRLRLQKLLGDSGGGGVPPREKKVGPHEKSRNDHDSRARPS